VGEFYPEAPHADLVDPEDRMLLEYVSGRRVAIPSPAATR
jgi:hypothetical protein